MRSVEKQKGYDRDFFNLRYDGFFGIVFFFFVSLAEMLWLGWVGVTLSWPFTLGFMGAVCAAWFLINLVGIYLCQRQVVVRWNAAYAAWKSGGSAEGYLKEMEQCEVKIKNDTGIMLVYGGIPLNDYISVHKIYLLKEMGRDRECLELLKSTLPGIKNPEVQKALSEVETEITKKETRQHGSRILENVTMNFRHT